MVKLQLISPYRTMCLVRAFDLSVDVSLTQLKQPREVRFLIFLAFFFVVSELFLNFSLFAVGQFARSKRFFPFLLARVR